MIAASWAVLHVDLSVDRPAVPESHRPVFVVFWWRELPLGVRTFLPEELPLGRNQIAALAADFAAVQLAARLEGFGGPARATFDGRPVLGIPIDAVRSSEDLLGKLDMLAEMGPSPAADISVIICTRDRPGVLAGCLSRLRGQQSPPGQIVVVDNSSGRTAEPAMSDFPDVLYVHEPRPGLSVARNAGIHASQGAVIAFTDDDVEPSRGWTREIARAFTNPNVDAVTGLVLPAELDTPAQRFFQLEMGGFGGECTPVTFDSRFFRETCPTGAQVWRVGAGANMAFRRTVFDKIGLFDERLGAGASGCSEDSEIWYRLLAGGGVCLFEPRAVVLHHHREHWDELRGQMRAYMKGHVSALFVQADRFGHRGNIRRVFRQLPAYFARTAFGAIQGGRSARLQILWEEVLGWLSGLQYAVRPGWRARSKSHGGSGALGTSGAKP